MGEGSVKVKIVYHLDSILPTPECPTFPSKQHRKTKDNKGSSQLIEGRLHPRKHFVFRMALPTSQWGKMHGS